MYFCCMIHLLFAVKGIRNDDVQVVVRYFVLNYSLHYSNLNEDNKIILALAIGNERLKS